MTYENFNHYGDPARMSPDVLQHRFSSMRQIFDVVFPDVAPLVKDLSLDLIGGFVVSLSEDPDTMQAATFLTRTVTARFMEHTTRMKYGTQNSQRDYEPDRGAHTADIFRRMHAGQAVLRAEVARYEKLRKELEEIQSNQPGLLDVGQLSQRQIRRIERLSHRANVIAPVAARFIPGPYDTDLKVGVEKAGVSTDLAELIGEHWMESATNVIAARGGRMTKQKGKDKITLQLGDDERAKDCLVLTVEFGTPPINPDIRYGQIVIKGHYGLTQRYFNALTRNDLMVLHLGFFPPNKGGAERRVGGVTSVSDDIAWKLYPVGGQLYVNKTDIQSSEGIKYSAGRLKSERYHSEIDVDKDVEVMFRNVREKILHHTRINSEDEVDRLFASSAWTEMRELIGTASTRLKEGEAGSNIETLKGVYLQELLIWLEADPYLSNAIAKRIGLYRLFHKVEDYASLLPNYFLVSDSFTVGTVVDPNNLHARAAIPGFQRTPSNSWQQRRQFLEATAPTFDHTELNSEVPAPAPELVERAKRRMSGLKIMALALTGRDVKSEAELYEAPTTEELFHIINTFGFDSNPLSPEVANTLSQRVGYTPEYFRDVVVAQVDSLFIRKNFADRGVGLAALGTVWKQIYELSQTGVDRFIGEQLERPDGRGNIEYYLTILRRLGLITHRSGPGIRQSYELTPRLVADDILQFRWDESFAGKSGESQYLSVILMKEIYRQVKAEPDALAIVKNFMDNSLSEHYPNLRAAVYAGIDQQLVTLSAERLSGKPAYKAIYRLLAIRRLLAILNPDDPILKKTLADDMKSIDNTQGLAHVGMAAEIVEAQTAELAMAEYLTVQDPKPYPVSQIREERRRVEQQKPGDRELVEPMLELDNDNLRRVLYLVDVLKPQGMLGATPFKSHREIVRHPKLDYKTIMDLTRLYDDSRAVEKMFKTADGDNTNPIGNLEAGLQFLRLWVQLDNIYQWERYLEGL